MRVEKRKAVELDDEVEKEEKDEEWECEAEAEADDDDVDQEVADDVVVDFYRECQDLEKEEAENREWWEEEMDK
eukprot:2626664-Heterocapsa_arctica.AAC.1